MAKWNRYSESSNWTKVYQWMANQMAEKGISCGENAPVWAWHSCGRFEQAPTLDVAGNLLSLFEIEAGVKTIEFEYPEHFTLLTNYGPWNDIIYHFLDGFEASKIALADLQALYDLEPDSLSEYDAIQATLPYLCMEWVVDIRDLKLQAENFEYDPAEFV